MNTQESLVSGYSPLQKPLGTHRMTHAMPVRAHPRCLRMPLVLSSRVFQEEEGGGGAYSFVFCLSRVTIDYAAPARRSTVYLRRGKRMHNPNGALAKQLLHFNIHDGISVQQIPGWYLEDEALCALLMTACLLEIKRSTDRSIINISIHLILS